jgi:hypothetical protein
MLPMSFDDPTMDDDPHEVLAAHKIVLGEEWADGRHRLGVVRAVEVDEGLGQRLRTGGAVGDVKKNCSTRWQLYTFRVSRNFYKMGQQLIS